MSKAEVVRVERAFRRIRAGAVAAAALGTVAVWWLEGWPWGLGFLAGAVASVFNFRWLEQLAAGLGPGAARRRLRFAILFGLRYLLLGAGGYVIVKVFGLSGLAIVAGLLVSVAAVLAEMIYELIHAGT
ncbi:MAG: ATP synthase subunit I [Acidobacteriota bacterium]